MTTTTVPALPPRHGRRRAQPWWRSELDRLQNPHIVVAAVVVAATEVVVVTAVTL